MRFHYDMQWRLVGVIGDYAVYQRRVDGEVQTTYVYMGPEDSPVSPG
jgi:hypothetical protein